MFVKWVELMIENACKSIEDMSEPELADLLLVDDDMIFLDRLGRAMGNRGFNVRLASTVSDARHMIAKQAPCYAVVDLRLGDGDGLEIINFIKDVSPGTRAIIHTGYGNIATAVSAVKLGAIDYLPKPADADEIVNVLLGEDLASQPAPKNPMSANRVKWEHIQRVFEQCDHNVSQTARKLGMHRRTLQRILSKRAPK